MGCNCASQEQITKLYKLYGDKSNNNNIRLSQRLTTLFRDICVYLVIFLILPFLILFVLYKGIFTKDKKISVRKLLKFKGDNNKWSATKNIIDNRSILENGE